MSVCVHLCESTDLVLLEGELADSSASSELSWVFVVISVLTSNRPDSWFPRTVLQHFVLDPCVPTEVTRSINHLSPRHHTSS